MLIFSLTLLYLFIAIQDVDSHVIRTREPDSTAVVKRPRNLDIPLLIDPVRQAGTDEEWEYDQLPKNERSVFSVPVRPSSGPSASDCPQGTRRVTADGPCLQETPMIKSTGDKFLVDSLRKFYTPNSHHNVRPHHRKRRPSTTPSTTTRRYEFVPAYVAGDISEANKPGDDTLTISGTGSSINSPENESPTTEAIIITTLTTPVKSVTEIPDSVPTTPLPVSAVAVTEAEAIPVTDELLVVFESTTQPIDPVIETTVKYDEPVEVTTEMAHGLDSDDKTALSDSAVTTTEAESNTLELEGTTAQPRTTEMTTMPTDINIDTEESKLAHSTAANSNVLTPTTTEPEIQASTIMMTMMTEVPVTENEVTEVPPTEATKTEFLETPTQSTPSQTVLTPNTALLVENMDTNHPELVRSERIAPQPPSASLSLPHAHWMHIPPHPPQQIPSYPVQPPQFYPTQPPRRVLPVQIDIRNPQPQRTNYDGRNYNNRENIYQNDHYINRNNYPRANFNN